jgi:hypothetical protein
MCLKKCIICGISNESNKYNTYIYTINATKDEYINIVNYLFFINDIPDNIEMDLKNTISGYFCDDCKISNKYLLKTFKNNHYDVHYVKPEYNFEISRKRKRYTEKTYKTII